MKRKMVRGIIVLIALVGIAGFFLLIGQKTDTEPKKVYNEPAEEILEKIRDGLAAQEAAKPPPPGASPNGHWHDGEWHEGAHEASSAPKTYDGPLTYHEGLLKTNPVKALRLQAEERGHWSAEWIPPFPVDDQEAASFARNIYLIAYYKNSGETETAAFQKIVRAQLTQLNVIDEYPFGARRSDLLKLTWAILPSGSVKPYGYPSDYFPRSYPPDYVPPSFEK